jgi:hypothetical protein
MERSHFVLADFREAGVRSSSIIENFSGRTLTGPRNSTQLKRGLDAAQRHGLRRIHTKLEVSLSLDSLGERRETLDALSLAEETTPVKEACVQHSKVPGVNLKIAWFMKT